jgi:chromate transporter
MQLFALFLFHFYEHPRARSIFCGLRPAVVGLIATAAWQIALVTIWPRVSCCGGCPLGLIEWRAVVICLVSVVLIVRGRLHPGWLVLGAAVAGMLLF